MGNSSFSSQKRRRQPVARPRASRWFWSLENGSQRICRHKIETPRQFCRDENGHSLFQIIIISCRRATSGCFRAKRKNDRMRGTKWKTADHREMHSAEEISSRLFLCIHFIEVIDNMFTEWDRPPFISHSVFFRLLSLFFSPSMRANERK